MAAALILSHQTLPHDYHQHFFCLSTSLPDSSENLILKLDLSILAKNYIPKGFLSSIDELKYI